MAFHVLCISHTDGAGGEQIGRDVAARLGFRYVNEEIILEAARLARVDPAVIAATEQKQTFLQRILDSLSSAQEALGPAALAAGFAVPIVPEAFTRRADRDDLRSLIRAAIHEVARSGDAVIVAHAASFALVGKPNVLRVLVTAPDRVRMRRIGKKSGLPEAEAEDVMHKGDRARREYLRTFYDIDEELPTHYDMTVNTEVLSAAQATECIVRAATAEGAFADATADGAP